MNRLESIRYDLIMMAEREAMKLWRLARKAQEHGVSNECINNIREEAFIMHDTMRSYPERLLNWDFKYNYKYAFKY